MSVESALQKKIHESDDNEALNALVALCKKKGIEGASELIKKVKQPPTATPMQTYKDSFTVQIGMDKLPQYVGDFICLEARLKDSSNPFFQAQNYIFEVEIPMPKKPALTAKTK